MLKGKKLSVTENVYQQLVLSTFSAARVSLVQLSKWYPPRVYGNNSLPSTAEMTSWREK